MDNSDPEDGTMVVDQSGNVVGKVSGSNTYAAKKTVAQGMMDIALITANANQLRYLVEFQSNSPTFYFTLSLIIVSLFLQVVVGITLIFKGRYDLKGESKFDRANKMNNYVVVGVFLITVINVFIAAFSITGDSPDPQAPSDRTPLLNS